MLVDSAGNSFFASVMQGRLTPSRGRGIHFFPFDGWQVELPKAAMIGLDGIEFVFDFERYKENPLWTVDGREEIKRLIKRFGIKVKHVCARFFIDCPFFRVTPDVTKANVIILKELIENAAEIGSANIEIPVLENSSIKTQEEEEIFLDAMGDCVLLARSLDLAISIESDLNPQRLAKLIKSFRSASVGVVYDGGNSASLGYDCKEEILILDPWINNVHIKDRIRNGGNVPLGSGSVNFKDLFRSLKLINYCGDFTFECARGEDSLEEKTVRQQLVFLEKCLKA